MSWLSKKFRCGVMPTDPSWKAFNSQLPCTAEPGHLGMHYNRRNEYWQTGCGVTPQPGEMALWDSCTPCVLPVGHKGPHRNRHGDGWTPGLLQSNPRYSSEPEPTSALKSMVDQETRRKIAAAGSAADIVGLTTGRAAEASRRLAANVPSLFCQERHPDDGEICVEPLGHGGAHRSSGRVAVYWPQEQPVVDQDVASEPISYCGDDDLCGAEHTVANVRCFEPPGHAGPHQGSASWAPSGTLYWKQEQPVVEEPAECGDVSPTDGWHCREAAGHAGRHQAWRSDGPVKACGHHRADIDDGISCELAAGHDGQHQAQTRSGSWIEWDGLEVLVQFVDWTKMTEAFIQPKRSASDDEIDTGPYVLSRQFIEDQLDRLAKVRPKHVDTDPMLTRDLKAQAEDPHLKENATDALVDQIARFDDRQRIAVLEEEARDRSKQVTSLQDQFDQALPPIADIGQRLRRVEAGLQALEERVVELEMTVRYHGRRWDGYDKYIDSLAHPKKWWQW